MEETKSKALVPIEEAQKNYVMLPDRHEWGVLQAMAKTASNTRFFNQLGGEAGILSIMLYARELNIPPMQAIMAGFHNIQGRVEMSARLMTMRIRQAGHALKLKEINHDRCVIYGKRRDTGEDMEASYTTEEAKAAGLVKADSNWMKFREDMLWARAVSRLARRLFPDVVGTAYAEGGILEMIPDRRESTIMSDKEEIVSPEFAPEDLAQEFDALIPAGADKAQVDQYVKICADHFHQTMGEFKAKVAQEDQFDDFLKAFEGWAAKQPREVKPAKEETEPEEDDATDPLWKAFRADFINLRQGGFSTWVFKNKARLAQAPAEILAEVQAKWAKLYPGNPFPVSAGGANQAQESATAPDPTEPMDQGENAQGVPPREPGCDDDREDPAPKWTGPPTARNSYLWDQKEGTR